MFIVHSSHKSKCFKPPFLTQDIYVYVYLQKHLDDIMFIKQVKTFSVCEVNTSLQSMTLENTRNVPM